MEASDYLIIDRYLQGELSEKEQTDLLQRLQEDTALAAALREREEMQRYLRHKVQRSDLKSRMGELGAHYFKEEGSSGLGKEKVIPLWKRKPVWLVAAAAAVALILLVWNPFQTSVNLYEQYAVHQPLALQERSLDGVDLEAAEAAFNEGRYEEAYSQLTALQEQLPDYPQLQLALGVSALETDRIEEARAQFEVLANGTSALQQYGRWYLALSYVKTGEYEQAKPLLRDLTGPPSAFQEPAKVLLQRLN